MLSEALKVVEDINLSLSELDESFFEEGDFVLSFHYTPFYSSINIGEEPLWDTECFERRYLEDVDDYESLKDCLLRRMSEYFEKYNRFSLIFREYLKKEKV